MRNAYSFAVGLIAGALDELGAVTVRDALMRAPCARRAKLTDGFDAFFTLIGR